MKKIFLFLLVFFISEPIFSQVVSKDLKHLALTDQKLPVFKVYNFENGELLKVLSLKEPVGTYVKSEDGSTYYILTKHFAYTVDVNTLEIQREWQHCEIFEKQKDELVDPNLSIYPIALTPSGVGLFNYNREVRAAALAMYKDHTKAQDYLEANQTTHLSKIDIVNETITPFVKLKLGVFPSIYGHNYIITDEAGKVKKLDFNTGELLQTYDVFPKEWLARVDLVKTPARAMYIKENVIKASVTEFKGMDVYFSHVYYDLSKNEIIKTEENILALADSQVGTSLCEKSYYSEFDKKEPVELPQMEMPELPTKYNKKAMAAYDAAVAKAQEEHTKKLEEYTKAMDDAINNKTVRIYSDEEKINLLFKLENILAVSIIKDKYVFVVGKNTYDMYDLTSKDLLYTIDRF